MNEDRFNWTSEEGLEFFSPQDDHQGKKVNSENHPAMHSDAMSHDSALSRFCRKSAILGINPFVSPKKKTSR